jgi:hypothetical protein
LLGETKEFTVDQARKLYVALGEIFLEPRVRVEKEYIYWPFTTWTTGPINFTQSWLLNTSANSSFSDSAPINMLSTEVK